MTFDLSNKIRISDRDDIYSKIDSSEMAFLVSRIDESWIRISDLVDLCSGMIPEEKVIQIISVMKESGIIQFKQKMETVEEFRDYGPVRFQDRYLHEDNDLPLAVKKEILFLSFYGKNLDCYSILGLSLSASLSEVSDNYKKLYDIINPEQYKDMMLGSYTSRIEKAFTFVKKSEVLLTEAGRKKYDEEFFNSSSSSEEAESKQINKENRPPTEEEKQELAKLKKAEKHFLAAKTFSYDTDYASALKEIVLSLYFDPSNKEYGELKKHLKRNLREQKIQNLFYRLENDESIYFDERNVVKMVDEIIALAKLSPSIYLRIAEIMIDKRMIDIAISLSEEAMKISPESADEAKKLILRSKEKRYKGSKSKQDD